MVTFMSHDTASLYGKTFQEFSDVSFLFFSDDDFNRWFSMNEPQVAEEISTRLKHASEGALNLPDKVPFDGVNNNLLLTQDKRMIVYTWTLPNGPHPLRWQSRDDFTEFVNSLL